MQYAHRNTGAANIYYTRRGSTGVGLSWCKIMTSIQGVSALGGPNKAHTLEKNAYKIQSHKD